jgi:Lar family restriction alleviation protein
MKTKPDNARPCPFCGRELLVVRAKRDKHYPGMVPLSVSCDVCSASGPYVYVPKTLTSDSREFQDQQDNAVSLWNARFEAG